MNRVDSRFIENQIIGSNRALSIARDVYLNNPERADNKKCVEAIAKAVRVWFLEEIKPGYHPIHKAILNTVAKRIDWNAVARELLNDVLWEEELPGFSDEQ